jgi:hypothetical protein
MNIILTYKLKKSDSIELIKLTPEQYFDKIAEGENLEDDAIAKYDQEGNYILDILPGIQFDDLDYTTVELTGSINSDFVTKTTYYGNDTKVIYRKDKSGFELLIQSIQVAINCIVITRMERQNNSSEWTNINLNVGMNYNKNDQDEEKWYSSKDGELINQRIPLEITKENI